MNIRQPGMPCRLVARYQVFMDSGLMDPGQALTRLPG